MTQLRHFDHLGTARFVTFSCYHRFRLLTSSDLIETFIAEIEEIRHKYCLKLYGYVVMPEHVHLVLWPPDSVKLGRVIGQLKSLSARRMLPLLRTQRGGSLDRLRVDRDGEHRLAFWQARCYDHNCRTSETVKEKIEYCHKNPMVRGLVAEPGDWPWSSYKWYAGCEDVPLSMDVPDFGI
jgi:putative transposase